MRIALVTVLSVAALPALLPATSRSGWWQDQTVQRELGLTPVQIASLAAAFNGTLAERRSHRLRLDELERAVQQMMASADADDGTAAALISRLEIARARRNALRTLMLLRMYRILSVDQRATLRRLAPPQHRDETSGH